MQYRYLALEHGTKLIQGAIEAGNDRLAEESLLRSGMKVISLKPVLKSKFFEGLKPRATKVNRKELVLFSQQLGTFLNSGTPLLTGIQLLRDQARNPAFRTVLDAVITDLRSGVSLSDAMEKHEKVFPLVYVRMVQAGERSGSLETVLAHLGIYLQREIAMAQQMKKALTYPSIVVVVGIIVIGILVTVVLPTLTDMLKQFNSNLPLLTRVIMTIGEIASTWKIPGVLGAIGGAIAFAWYRKQPAGRRNIHKLIINAPELGRLTVQQNLARFSRTMSLLLAAGLPLPECLALSRDSASNKIFQEGISSTRQRVVEGESLAHAMSQVLFVPSLYVQMVKTGEESGSLERNLGMMAEFYEREFEDRMGTLTTFIEPAITIVMGVTTVIIAMAVLLPMFDLYSGLQASS